MTAIYFKFNFLKILQSIDHSTVVGVVNWPLNGSEAGVELVFIHFIQR